MAGGPPTALTTARILETTCGAVRGRVRGGDTMICPLFLLTVTTAATGDHSCCIRETRAAIGQAHGGDITLRLSLMDTGSMEVMNEDFSSMLLSMAALTRKRDRQRLATGCMDPAVE